MGCPWLSATVGANVSESDPTHPDRVGFSSRGAASQGPTQRAFPTSCTADRGYDNEATRGLLRLAGHRAAHCQAQHGARAAAWARFRWVVERTIAWLKGLRRLRIRYDRLGIIQGRVEHFSQRGVICFRLLHDEAALILGPVLSEFSKVKHTRTASVCCRYARTSRPLNQTDFAARQLDSKIPADESYCAQRVSGPTV